MLNFDTMDKSRTYKAVYHGGGCFGVVKGDQVTLRYVASLAMNRTGWLVVGDQRIYKSEDRCFTLIPDTPTDITEDQLKDRTKVYTVIRTAGSTKRVKRGDTCVARWAGHGWYIYTDVQRLIKGEHWSYHSATCRVPVPLTKCYDVVSMQGINEVNGSNENNDKTGDETVSNSDKSVKWVKGLDNLEYPYDGLHLVCEAVTGYYYWVYSEGSVVESVFNQAKVRLRLHQDYIKNLRHDHMVRLCTCEGKLHKVTMASLDSDSVLYHHDNKHKTPELSIIQRFPESYILEQPEYISERQQKIQELKDKLAELEALENDGGDQ